MTNRRIEILGDPSKNKQNFTIVRLNILCCRFWKLDLWDCHDMAFPFWRIYWNKNTGGLLKTNQTIYNMEPDKIYVIPPFTSFSSKYLKNHFYKKGINVSGRSMKQHDNDELTSKSSLLHLFIHFNLGVPFDNVYPGIFQIKTTPHLLENLNYLTNRLKIENTNFYATYTLKLQSIINDILSNIGTNIFEALNVDYRILKVIRHLENHIEKNPTNSELASVANMATNSFSRLFTKKMNITLHTYVMKRKVAQACDLILHSNKSIAEIACDVGFSDRHHFSKVFKAITGTTPVVYRSGKFS